MDIFDELNVSPFTDHLRWAEHFTVRGSVITYPTYSQVVCNLLQGRRSAM